MKSRLLRIGIPVVGILLAALIGFGIYSIPPVEKALPPDAVDLIVSLTKPSYGSTVPLGTFTTVAATAIGGRPIAELELWVDGVSLETKAAPAASSIRQFTTFWTWTPLRAGAHTLVVRAVDSDGRIAGSNLVRVMAGDQTPGTASTSAVLPPASGGPAGTAGLPPSKFSFWLKNNILARFSTVKAPAAPGLSIQTSGCGVNLRITDSAKDPDGFFVYRLDAGGSDFRRVATLGPGSGGSIEYSDAGLAGHVEYFVSAFSTAGETPSDLAAADLDDPTCRTPDWSNLKIQKADLTVTVPVEKLYCYYAFGDGPWARLPESSNDFILSKNGVFDLASAFGALPSNTGAGDVRLALNCWGWEGGTLLDLGSASKTLSPADTKGTFKLSGGTFDLVGSIIVDKLDPLPLFDISPLIMPPTNFKSTTSLAACKGHAGVGGSLAESICSASLATGATVLIWDWVPSCIFPVEGSKIKCSDYIKDTDGFRIYKTTGKTTVLFRTIKSRDQSMLAFPAGSLDGPPASYTVRAFSKKLDSDDSNPYSFSGPGVVTKTVVIRDPIIAQDEHNENNQNHDLSCKIYDFFGLDKSGLGTDSGPARTIVGFYNSYDKGSFPFYCWGYIGWWSRAQVKFEFGGEKGPVWKAQLGFQTKPGAAGGGGYDGFASCADTINFLTGADTFEAYDSLSPTVTTYTLDVTEAVKRWVENGEPNYGFLFRPYKEKGAFTNDMCWSELTNFELTVTYFVSA